MLLVLMIRVLMNVTQFVNAECMTVCVVPMVIVNQDRLGGERAKHERWEHTQRDGHATNPLERTYWYVSTPSAH